MSDKCVGSVKIEFPAKIAPRSINFNLRAVLDFGGEEIICARSTSSMLALICCPNTRRWWWGTKQVLSEKVALGAGAGGGEIVGLNPKS